MITQMQYYTEVRSLKTPSCYFLFFFVEYPLKLFTFSLPRIQIQLVNQEILFNSKESIQIFELADQLAQLDVARRV